VKKGEEERQGKAPSIADKKEEREGEGGERNTAPSLAAQS